MVSKCHYLLISNDVLQHQLNPIPCVRTLVLAGVISARTNLKISFFRQESASAWGVKLRHRTFPGRTEAVPFQEGTV
jgi:hypothetical protein